MFEIIQINTDYEYETQYPGYGFAQHKGYGTAAHYEALMKLGPSPIHRQTFLRSVADRLANRLDPDLQSPPDRQISLFNDPE